MKGMMLKTSAVKISALTVAICLFAGMSSAKTFVVAPDGSDANPGTKDRPFATLERARDQIRQLIAGGGMPSGGITVELRGGVYERARPFELGPEDSGTEKSPVLYRSRKGETVRIIGGRIVTGWERATDPAVLKRLDEPARANVWRADLKSLGITDLEGIGRAEVYQSDPGASCFSGTSQTLSRYPNAGYLYIAGPLMPIVSESPRVYLPRTADSFATTPDGRWVGEKDVGLHGFWVWEWPIAASARQCESRGSLLGFPQKAGYCIPSAGNGSMPKGPAGTRQPRGMDPRP